MSAASVQRSVPGAPVETAKPRNPLSRARIERISDRTVSAFGLVFGLQTLPTALGQLGYLRSPWGLIVLVLVFGGLAFTVLLAIFAQRFVKVTMGWIMLPRRGGGAVRHGCALRLDAVGLGVGW